MLIPVERADDERLSDYVDLRHTPARDAVIVEGAVALEQVPASPYLLRSVLCFERHTRKVRALVGDEATIYVAPEPVLRATVGFDLHRGVVASCGRAPELSAADLVRDARVLLATERLNDVENLGSLFRNARAFGVDAVLLDAETADPLNRRTVRVSLGHVLRVPFARADRWPLALDGVTVAALAPRGDVDVRDLASIDGPIAIVVGAEGAGLGDEALAAADLRVRIPMADGVDSLNVATAAAVALYELSRR